MLVMDDLRGEFFEPVEIVLFFGRREFPAFVVIDDGFDLVGYLRFLERSCKAA
jgi:hypothetical protein